MTDEDARRVLRIAQWPGGIPICPRCSTTPPGSTDSWRRKWFCGQCRIEFSDQSLTPLRGFRLPPSVLVRVATEALGRGRPSVRKLAATANVSTATAARVIRAVSEGLLSTDSRNFLIKLSTEASYELDQ